MSTDNALDSMVPSDHEMLSEVIGLPRADAPSFYQRNSGSLPKSGQGMSDAHRRAQLPTPTRADPDTIGDRIRRLFGR
jgi:hypothetical protein